MNNLRNIGLIILALLPAVSAAEVYRWVDEHGRVHFGDRPKGPQAEQVDITPSTPARAAPRPAAVPDRQRLLDMYQQDREDKRAAKAEQAKQRAKRDRACAKTSRDLRRYLASGPLYDELPDGGRRYLTATEKDAELAELRGLLTTHCGGVPEDLRRKAGR